MNKIAVITGGSRGLGKNMVLAIADKGFDVIFSYHSNKTEADKVVEEVLAKGQKALALQLDTSKIETFDAFIGAITSHLQEKTGDPKFHVLINNAGIGINEPIVSTSEEQFDTLMNIHLKGTYFLTQKAIPFLNDGGKIINISSGLARFCGPGFSAYAMMKGGIEVFTRYLAKELGSRKITANTVAPGAIETDFGGGVVRDNEQYNAYVSNVTALGRPGLPNDIGGVVAFLCTDEANWINAQRIEVSGGMNI